MRIAKLPARARLTLVYLVLFVALGSGLLVLNYQLLASRLDRGSTAGDDTGETVREERITRSDPPRGTGRATESRAAETVPSRAVASAIDDYRSEALQTLLRASVMSLAAATVMAGLLTWWVARRTLRPLEAMSEATSGSPRTTSTNACQRRARAMSCNSWPRRSTR